ncbi:hypothetical protein LINPERPRIM_LOCUS20872 [Linum perenne]
MTVKDLLIAELHEWDEELLEDLFQPQDVDFILNMRPPCGSEKDARIWSLSSNGDYTVRSAYRSIIERDQQFNNLRVDGNWRQLWQADVPPKVKHHVWRLARNVLPTKVALRGRRVPIEQTCGCCGLMEETLEHLFFSCKVAEQCWELVGETTAVRAAMQLEGGAIEWLFGIIANATRDRIAFWFSKQLREAARITRNSEDSSWSASNCCAINHLVRLFLLGENVTGLLGVEVRAFFRFPDPLAMILSS